MQLYLNRHCVWSPVYLSLLMQFLSSECNSSLSPLFYFQHLNLATLEQAIYFFLWIMWHASSFELHLMSSFLFVLSFDFTWTSFRKKTSTQRFDSHPYLKPSHINHPFIRSLVFVFARFKNSHSGWESPPNNVFITQVLITEVTTGFFSKSNAVLVSIIKAVCVSDRIFHKQSYRWTVLHQR